MTDIAIDDHKLIPSNETDKSASLNGIGGWIGSNFVISLFAYGGAAFGAVPGAVFGSLIGFGMAYWFGTQRKYAATFTGVKVSIGLNALMLIGQLIAL